MKNLIIVESPAKATTIEKFLGKDYRVMSSFGHIRDLSKKEIGIDTAGNFQPDYEIPADKKELVRKLKAAAASADMVWLASDEDREGEAIAWHLYEVLGLKPDNTRRIVFHEITEPAIRHALANPRGIDINRVDAQQARRVLDRIVGFELSPVLWRKIKPALSAGRVQSVAVRLICERENEIEAFKAEPYYRVTADLTSGGSTFRAELSRRFDSEEDARDFLNRAAGATMRVASVSTKPVKRAPAPPFTTSTLQQEASRRLGFSVSRTMSVAQRLYEAGHITYMRTDSLNLSDLAVADMARAITTDFGADYLHTRRYHTSSKGAQEAHEAIRPTYITNTDIEGSEPERRLYRLIRRRALASQMADARLSKTTAEISIDGCPEHFTASGETLDFPGFLALYESSEPDAVTLPPLKEGAAVEAADFTATERFSMPPVRYTEATLVKKMEDLGIGRPSTYAPTISTIQAREYVEKGEKEGTPRQYRVLTLTADGIQDDTRTENTGSDKGKLVPTDVGMVVNDFLTSYFPDILDYNFTARIEEKFDEIAEGKLGWHSEISDFYRDFHPEIEKVSALRLEHKVGERELGTDPKSGRPVSVKIGRFGPVAQLGAPGEDDKPVFAALQKGQSVATITLEEALRLFELPRTLGTFEDKTVTAAIGRFGPYIRHDKSFTSIPAPLTPQSITLEEAIELIEAKRRDAASKIVKEFAEMPGLSVVNGRFGVYLAYKPEGAAKAQNFRLPKGTDGAALTFAEAKAIMEAPAPAKRATRKALAKKSTKKSAK